MFVTLGLFVLLLQVSLQNPHGLKTNPEKDPVFWHDLAREEIDKYLRIKDNTKVAKNVIFFLGDGMSISTLTASRIYKGQKEGSERGGEEGALTFEQFPNVGLIKTYNIDKQVSDSASTATAYLCGSKAQFKTVGMAGSVEREDTSACSRTELHVHSIGQWALDAGKDAGFVTTTRVTHATPAGLYAHSPYRYWEGDAPEGCKDIAKQLVQDEPGSSFKVIMGGGKDNMIRNQRKSSEEARLENEKRDEEDRFLRREDDEDLIQQWVDSKEGAGFTAAAVLSKKELDDVDVSKTDYLMGIFDGDHMPYEDERDESETPHIAEMTEKAIEMLSKSDNGFFLLVEGGRIDHAHHSNKANRALNEAVAMDKAIETALGMVDLEETLIVVTADHAHSMQINGDPDRGNVIGGFSGKADNDNKPFTTLLYANGPGEEEHYSAERDGLRCKVVRKDLTHVDTTAYEYRQTSAIYQESSNHAGDDVAIYATGPMAHMFRSLHEQSYIPHLLAYSMCVGPYYHNDACRSGR